jgi:hypothetical protein
VRIDKKASDPLRLNAHNIDAFVNCFIRNFVGDHPVHPERNLIGAEQVRKNWTALFAQVPLSTIPTMVITGMS